jgi:hypothetical protein
MTHAYEIAVIGTGTAGITTISHLLAWLPKDCTVISISDPSVPILGIGESTTTSIPESLYYGADFNFLDDHDKLDATVKHGVKYSNWRNNSFYTVIPPPHYGIHFNNFKLKEVCFEKFRNRWGEKFKVIEGNIEQLINGEHAASCVIDNTEHKFDYIIDCRGYPDSYEDYDLVETIPVNHCIVHTINQPGNWTYTHHMATPDGWMFGIPLQTRQGWGYLYNDTITTKEQAIENQAKMLNVDPSELNLREFKFKNFKAKKFIDNRIIKNGNRALFYEPLEALSGWFYDRVIRAFFDVVITNKYSEADANSVLLTLAEDYELFICYMYHGGSTFDSEFWKITKNRCNDRIQNSDKFFKNIEFLKQVTTQHYGNPSVILPFPYKTWKQIDSDLGYHYFESPN